MVITPRGETWYDEPIDLHDEQGNLTARGYAISMLIKYDRARIKASKMRIKEWDYYLINDDDYAIALTLNDMGYLGMISASFLDFNTGAFKTSTVLTPFPLGKFNMPSTSAEGLSEFENKQVRMRLKAASGARRLECVFKKFDGDEELSLDIVLDREPKDSMVIATPWAEDPSAFYFNQKIIAMRAEGSFTKGSLKHCFSPETSFGLLDWGRGVWTRDNTWYWSAAQGWQDGIGGNEPGGHVFGFNLGYGFGDTSAASENMVFVDGVAHKLGRVNFGIPELPEAASAKLLKDRFDFMNPWHFTDDEGRLDLVFTPSIDRCDYTDVKLIVSDQHQVFGSFSGYVILDDGTRFEVRDLRGFAEAVRNKY
ncbi:MAG: DUF2804 domain-containing protein [Eggerthellaceae bacterium]|nr:DUF2804 domain-containing protein [Eggerthellaceae bacterium]